jgi:hypothetical protein
VFKRSGENTRLKGARKKPYRPKPEEQEGMPQQKHCPPTKRREERSQSTMKSNIKTWHEFSPHITLKRRKET